MGFFHILTTTEDSDKAFISTVFYQAKLVVCLCHKILMEIFLSEKLHISSKQLIVLPLNSKVCKTGDTDSLGYVCLIAVWLLTTTK